MFKNMQAHISHNINRRLVSLADVNIEEFVKLCTKLYNDTIVSLSHTFHYTHTPKTLKHRHQVNVQDFLGVYFINIGQIIYTLKFIV